MLQFIYINERVMKNKRKRHVKREDLVALEDIVVASLDYETIERIVEGREN